jgi:hypothetical protein
MQGWRLDRSGSISLIGETYSSTKLVLFLENSELQSNKAWLQALAAKYELDELDALRLHLEHTLHTVQDPHRLQTVRSMLSDCDRVVLQSLQATKCIYIFLFEGLSFFFN